MLLFWLPGTSKAVSARIEALGQGGGVYDGRRPASLPITVLSPATPKGWSHANIRAALRPDLLQYLFCDWREIGFFTGNIPSARIRKINEYPYFQYQSDFRF